MHEGREFHELKRGGASLQCQVHIGENCWKDVSFGKYHTLDVEECCRRLLQWEFDAFDEAGELIDRDIHVSRGGQLLKKYE